MPLGWIERRYAKPNRSHRSTLRPASSISARVSRLRWHGERAGCNREQRQRQVGDERPAQAHQGSGDERADGRREALEQLIEALGDVGLDLEHRQDEHQRKAGQHESEPGDERSVLAAPDPAEVDPQLVRLAARQHLVGRSRPPDPSPTTTPHRFLQEPLASAWIEQPPRSAVEAESCTGPRAGPRAGASRSRSQRRLSVAVGKGPGRKAAPPVR